MSRKRYQQAFSLVESLVTVSIIAVLSTVSIAVIGYLLKPSAALKLKSDVRVANSAVDTYIAFGGVFSGKEDHSDVITKLKTRATADTEHRVVGLRGSFLDARIEPVMQTVKEAATVRERAYWDPAKNTFIVATSGPPGIKRFQLNESLQYSGDLTESRETVESYAEDSGWIWDYEEQAPVFSPGPSLVVTGNPPDTVLAVPTPPVAPPLPPLPSVVTLDPPEFGLPPGLYSITSYDMAVPIANPNPGGSSSIFYLIDFGEWEQYSGSGVTVPPGGVLRAQAIPAISSYAESSVTSGDYAVIPVDLLPPVISPSAPEFTPSTLETITITIGDPNAANSAVEYSIGGSGSTPYTGPFDIQLNTYPGGVLIAAIAVPTAP